MSLPAVRARDHQNCRWSGRPAGPMPDRCSRLRTEVQERQLLHQLAARAPCVTAVAEVRVMILSMAGASQLIITLHRKIMADASKWRTRHTAHVASDRLHLRGINSHAPSTILMRPQRGLRGPELDLCSMQRWQIASSVNTDSERVVAPHGQPQFAAAALGVH